MARGLNESEDPRQSEASPKKTPSPTRLWLREAWNGWLKSISWLLVLAIGYVAYSQHWLNERTGGVLLVAAIVGGTIALTVGPAYGHFAGWKRKGPFIAFVAVWAFAAGYPSLSATWPKTALKEFSLGETPEHLSQSVDLAGEKGPFELSVGGMLKGSGEGEANYRLVVTGDNQTSDELGGTIKRTVLRQRVSRRGGTASIRQEHTENVHRLTHIQGSKLNFSVDSVDEQLDQGIHVSIHRASFDTTWLLVIAGLCVLIGLFLDYRLAAPKVKTHFTMAAGMVAVFAYHYPIEATPHFLVPPAISSGFIAFLTGGLAGALLGWIARNLKPKPKRR